MATTIQINNLDALERLIGGDSALEIELRNNIVQNFAQKHLKCLVNTGALEDVKKSIISECTKRVEELVGKVITGTYRYDSHIQLNDAIKTAISSQVDTLIRDQVRGKIEERFKAWENGAITKTINDRVDVLVKQTIEAGVKEKFEKMLKSAL